MEISSKTKYRTTIGFCYTTPEHISKECKSAYSRDSSTPMLIAALFTSNRNSLDAHQPMNG
jgi:hypothetical protein